MLYHGADATYCLTVFEVAISGLIMRREASGSGTGSKIYYSIRPARSFPSPEAILFPKTILLKPPRERQYSTVPAVFGRWE